MCQMFGLPQTLHNRTALREDLSNYLVESVQQPWMQELMASLQEIEWKDMQIAQRGFEYRLRQMAGGDGGDRQSCDKKERWRREEGCARHR